VLELTIQADGSVSEVAVVGPAGPPWDEAARAAAFGFAFEPARVDGEAIAVRVQFEYVFQASLTRGPMVEDRRARKAPEASPGYVVTGRLREQGRRDAIAGVVVVLMDASGGRAFDAVSEDDGSFEISGVPEGEYSLSIGSAGWQWSDQTVRVGATAAEGLRESVGTVRLRPGVGTGYRTVVRGEAVYESATVIELSDKELTQTPGTFGDPTRVVATLPGVGRSPFGLGYYVVRGANFDNTGFFIDGHPALFLYHLLGGPAVIHPELVGQISFYPGGYPARYGRFATGVIALETKDPPRDRWHLDLEVDVLKASALASIPFDEGRGAVTVAARRSYFELVLPLVQDDLELSYTDYQVRVGWEPTRDVRLRFLALGAEDRFATGESGGSDDSSTLGTFSLGFHRLVAAADWDLARGLTWSNSVAWEYDHTTGQRASQDDDDLRIDFAGWFLQGRSWLTVAPHPALSLEAGLDVIYVDVAADLVAPAPPPFGDPPTPAFDPIAIAYGIAGPYLGIAPYVSAAWEPVPGLRFIPGVRFSLDRFGEGFRYTVDPKVAVRWQVHPDWTLKAMTAVAHQPPAVFQYAEPYGDPAIPMVRSLQISGGLEWQPWDGWEVSVEGFVNYLDELSRPQDLVTDDDGNLQSAQWVADVRARAYGMEVLIRKQLGDWAYGWVSYTLSRSERNVPPDGWRLSTFDQSHVLNLAWSFELGAGWTVGTRFTLTSGTPYFPVRGARYDADADRYEPIFAAEQSRLPLFHRLDLRVDKTWLFDDWILGLYLDVQNVYNSPNPESLRYSYDYSIRSNGPGVPILPTIGVKARF
jgi:hypothetical protein